MRISFLGHASFLITTGDKKILTDPFNEEVGYPLYEGEVDYVTVSHGHWDHAATDLLKGKFTAITTSGKHDFGNIVFTGIKSYHDAEKGALRGENLIFIIEAEGIRIAHLGDLGHLLAADDIKKMGKIDLLLIPVGGTFTINANEAITIVNELKPRIVIPMHYDTPHLTFDLAPVEDFTQHYEVLVKKPELDINLDNLDKVNKIILLDYLS